VWSDYDGNEIYGEFTLHQEEPDPPEAKQEQSFVMGLATVGWTDNVHGERVPDDPTLRYYHGNMIGTTRFMTDFVGDPGEEAVYTAFGRRIDGSPRRFGYAGAWGYQSTLDDQTPPAEVFPFLHVGHRYYDPATGRFLQRDPIGIRGGWNVYAYVRSAPVSSIDPEGLYNSPNGPHDFPPRTPLPEPISYSPEDMERMLELERQLQAGCTAGLLAIGGWEALATRSIIGVALDVAGWLGWGWTYFG
jgi:RHS repeat-associated protein